jgi:hypothetical protein
MIPKGIGRRPQGNGRSHKASLKPVSDWDDKTKVSTPVSAHSLQRFTASTSCPVGTEDVGGDLDQVDEHARNISNQLLADIFEFEHDVL